MIDSPRAGGLKTSRLFTVFASGALLMSLGCLIATPLDRGDSSRRVSVSDGWIAMGTLFEVELRVREEEVAGAERWIAESRLEILRLEKIYSRHDPDSDVSRLNDRLAEPDVLGAQIAVAPELERLLLGGVEVWGSSGGAFDMTVGPLIDLWSNAAAEEKWPGVDALRRVKAQVGSDRLVFAGAGFVGVAASGMRIDLDGISKGAVLDRLRESLVADFPDVAALLSFGESSVLALGDPDGRGEAGGWRLEVQSRSPGVGALARIRLRDKALSVSSSVGRVRQIAGQQVSHVVDPRSGGAIEGVLEAVVVGDRAMLVDGWSTAMLVLGAGKEAIRSIEKVGLEAMASEFGGRSAATEGWDRLTLD